MASIKLSALSYSKGLCSSIGCAALLVLSLLGCDTGQRSPGRFLVGVTTASYLDRGTGRPITCEVWYPTADNAREEPQPYAAGKTVGMASRDAPVRPKERFAWVVMSHGYRGSRFDLSWLAEALARAGFVVVSIDHPQGDAATFDMQEAPKLWVRARAVSSVIDGVLQSQKFANVVDPQRIALVGHSLGGATVLLDAGATLNPQGFAAMYPEAGPVPQTALLDRRVRAVVALAPGTAAAFVSDALTQVSTPVMIVSGTADWHTPERDNAGYFAHHLPHATWHSMPHVGHYTFTAPCTWYGKFRARKVCTDRWNANRAQTHAQVATWTREFLARHLKD